MILKNIKFKNTNDLKMTSIPNVFIDEYMPKAHPLFVVIYIYFYRYNLNREEGISAESAMKCLNVLESDIINAFKYWKTQKLIDFVQTENTFELEFLEILPKEKNEIKIDFQGVDKNLVQSRPQYSVQELEMIQSKSNEVNQLFFLTEKILGKTLNFNDLSVIFGLYDWLRIPLPVIEILLKYCEENNHRSTRYIEIVGIDWAEKEINTIDKANEYINLFNKEYR